MARARPIPTNAEYAVGLGRAFGGALIFAFPLLMTMEMWQFGFHMERYRLALFLALGLPLLFGLSYYAGFRPTWSLRDDLLDALAAYAVGFVAAAALLGLFAVIGPQTPPRELVGKVALQALPAAIGAVLARKQFGRQQDEERLGDGEDDTARKSYASELFLMAVGALFLAFNVAPTEEMVLIAYQMGPWHAVALALASLAVLHVMVFSVGFAGQEEGHGSGSTLRTFLHFTVVGYAIALMVTLYILWTFSRTDSGLNGELIKTVVVLGFPASIGAAAARLLV